LSCWLVARLGLAGIPRRWTASGSLALRSVAKLEIVNFLSSAGVLFDRYLFDSIELVGC
jgi:hypothetical protein